MKPVEQVSLPAGDDLPEQSGGQPPASTLAAVRASAGAEEGAGKGGRDLSPDAIEPEMSEEQRRTKPLSSLGRWMLADQSAGHHEGPYENAEGAQHHVQAWWKVVCLTGVDYFSTLGYQPGIAFLAAQFLSPVATLILVLLTLFGALPIYKRVAQESPHGQGSIAMLERLLSWWQGKLFVLALLGFAATDFIITMTLSAADAAQHIIENPYSGNFIHPGWAHDHRIAITLFLLALLGAVFLKGFKEAIGLAVGLTSVYLVLNAVVVGRALFELFTHPQLIKGFTVSMWGQSHGNPFLLVGYSLLVFPSLALGLSGFETGVAVMPTVKGDKGDDPVVPQGRINNTRKLLTSAAAIMSVFLITSSFATSALIPAREFCGAGTTRGIAGCVDLAKPGAANGRALAYLAHILLGDTFGTFYDVSTILILWFAGASAMAALLNLVPRYLPRYGMAPNWANASRPLVIVFSVIGFVVTLLFRADVDAQGGAYATGVLVLITSASFAAMLSARSARQKGAATGFALSTLVFAYTTVVNVFDRPEGLKIASFFIGTIIFISLLSRILRTTELRIDRVTLDEAAQRFIQEAISGSHNHGPRIIANKRTDGDSKEYAEKEDRQRLDSHIPASMPIMFLEVDVSDASDFSGNLLVQGVEVDGYRVLRSSAPSVPNAIAALLLYLRDTTGKRPHAYFAWSEGNPLVFMLRYLAFGQGDTAPVTREVLRQAEPDPGRRPKIHVDG